MLIRPPYLWKTLLIVALDVAFIWLGLWQLDRWQARRAANALLAQRLAAPPVLVQTTAPDADWEQWVDQQAVAQGVYAFEHQFAIKQQSYEGQPGIYLAAPLVLPDGQHAIIVHRGWLPLDQASPAAWSAYDQPGQVTVAGVLQPSQALPSTARATRSAPLDAQRATFRLDIPALQTEMPYTLLPVYLLEAPADAPADRLPRRLEAEVDLSEGPHLSYAIQWFAFAIIFTVGYLYYWRRTVVTG